MSKYLSPLSDADASATSELARRRRARTTIADAEAAHRAQLLTWLVAEFAKAPDPLDQIRLAAVASDYDKDHPDEPSLLDELTAAAAGDESTGVAA